MEKYYFQIKLLLFIYYFFQYIYPEYGHLYDMANNYGQGEDSDSVDQFEQDDL